MQIAICEDVKRDSDKLCELLHKYCSKHQLDMQYSLFSNGEDFLKSYEAGKYQIIFLDILMDGTNGIKVAEEIRRIDTEVTLIFVTVSREFAVDSYAVDAAFYLLKPLDMESLSRAMEKCRFLLQQYAKSITITESRHIVNIRLRDIVYLESQRNNCVIYTKGGEIRTRAKLSEIERELGGLPFLQCHRSFIVNLLWATDMLEQDFIMNDGIKVPVSRGFRMATEEAFRKFLTENARKTT